MKRKSIYILLCLSLGCQSQITLEEEMFEELITTLTASIDYEQAIFEKELEKAVLECQDPAKFRYYPLIDGMITVYSQNAEINLQIEAIKQKMAKTDLLISIEEKHMFLKDLTKQLVDNDTRVWILYDSIITANLENFGFRANEFSQRKKYEKEAYQSLLLKYSTAISPSTEKDNIFQLKLKTLQLNALKRQTYLANLFINLKGSMNGGFELFVPMVFPEKSCIKVGEWFEADIRIGNIFTNYNPETTKIVINGDTINVDKESKVSYKVKAKTVGEYELKMTSIIQNNLTGELIRAGSSYVYVVQ